MKRVFEEEEIDQLIQESNSFSISKAISEGWNLMNIDLGVVIGGGIIMGIISIVMSQFSSGILNFIFGDVLIAGMFVLAHRAKIGESLVINNIFDGFRELGPLILGRVFRAVLSWVIIGGTVTIAFVFADGVDLITNWSSDLIEESPELLISFVKDFIILILIGACFLFLIEVFYAFFVPLVMTFKLKTWQALETSRKLATKNFFSVLGLLIMIGLINFLGALALIVGLIVTIPLSYFILYAAFNQMLPEDFEKETRIEDHLLD